MNKKAQVVVIALWVVIILSIMAVGLGHRVSLGLRFSQYQKDGLKALYLAKAGVRRAIAEIEKDDAGVDSLKDKWADNESVFSNITLADNANEFAVVSYEENKFGVRDEERKININTASQELLVSLLEERGIADAAKIAFNIRAWRGDAVTPIPDYQELGYPNKAGKFSNIEELMLVKDLTSDIYNGAKELITVYPEGAEESININTVSSEALAIFTHAAAKKLSIAESFSGNIITQIIDLRNRSEKPFTKKEDINITLTGDEETNIFNKLMEGITFQSNNFLIEVSGNAGKIKRKVTAVYKRSDKKIIYWHES